MWKDGTIAMIKADLSDVYRDYIACLNKQIGRSWSSSFMTKCSTTVGRIGLSGIAGCSKETSLRFRDLHFNIRLLIFDPPYVASRLGFDCTPKGKFRVFL